MQTHNDEQIAPENEAPAGTHGAAEPAEQRPSRRSARPPARRTAASRKAREEAIRPDDDEQAVPDRDAATVARRRPISIVDAVSGSRPGRLLGEILVSKGRLTVDEVERILQLQGESDLRFGETAVKAGLLDETDLQIALAEQFGFPCVRPEQERVDPDVIAAYRPFDPRVETFRALRAQLTLRWLDATPGGRTIAVVSPEHGEGRSYITANLAVVFAQLGARTVLIDADMRNPRQHALFKLPNRSGLSAILSGRGDTESVQRVEPFEALSVITAGATPPNPQELLARPAFSELLQELARVFYVVIVDTPPGVGVADVQFICRSAGAALMVLRKNRTRARSAARLLDDLGPTRATLVGTVLNEF
jgi:receptor protein-tyrosine kinase